MTDFADRYANENKAFVRICDFTGSYEKIQEFERLEKEICDLSDISESNGYCSDQAAEQIRHRLADLPAGGLHYLDDGNHHYLTRLWIEKISEPFDLIVFDHHTDMQPAALLPFLSCGNWILKSLQEVEMLQDVWIIGPPKDAFADLCGFEDRVHIMTQEEADRIEPEQLQNSPSDIIEGDRPVYISIDLDVLSPDEFTSIWDQGSMSKQKLSSCISCFLEKRNVKGIDICG